MPNIRRGYLYEVVRASGITAATAGIAGAGSRNTGNGNCRTEKERIVCDRLDNDRQAIAAGSKAASARTAVARNRISTSLTDRILQRHLREKQKSKVEGCKDEKEKYGRRDRKLDQGLPGIPSSVS